MGKGEEEKEGKKNTKYLLFKQMSALEELL